MNRNLNILVASVLVALSPDFASAEPAERFVGRLRCSNPTADLRSGSFNLGVGDVRFEGGKGCVKPFADYPNCEWTIELRRVEKWGPAEKYLLVVLNADHDTSGAWDSVFMYVCQAGTFVSAFAERYLYGAKVEVGSASGFAVTAGEWLPNDPTCCPSHERRSHFALDERQGQFVPRESEVTVREKP